MQKRYYSINVQAICDNKRKFMQVSAKWPGSTNNSFILKTSTVWPAFENGNNTGRFCLSASKMVDDTVS